MSRVNGDKSLFNRKRKQNIARRERTRKLRESLAGGGNAASASQSTGAGKKATA
jgi:hypothetical protein